jgi:hypothetical protein
MNDVSGAAEVRDNRYGTSAESFENYACTIVTKRWKYKDIGRSQVSEDFRMAEPAIEGSILLDTEGSRKLLEAVPLRAIADHCKAGQITSQKGSRRAQSKITSLPGNQPANENQLKFGAVLRTALVNGTLGETDAGLGDKKQFVAICGKLGIRLGRSGYYRCRVAIGGASKR